MDKTKRWSIEKIPLWDEKLKNGNMLEKFIYNNEPAGIDETNQFRTDLVNLLNEQSELLLDEVSKLID